jgi:hypothetical protein
MSKRYDPFFVKADSVEELNSKLSPLGIRPKVGAYYNDQKQRFEVMPHTTPEGEKGYIVHPVSPQAKTAFRRVSGAATDLRASIKKSAQATK